MTMEAGTLFMQAGNVWELFEKTGNIGVYILYKKLSGEQTEDKAREEQVVNADTNRGNCD